MNRSELFINPNKEQRFANTLTKVLKCRTMSSAPISEVVEKFVALNDEEKDIVEKLIIPIEFLDTLERLDPLLNKNVSIEDMKKSLKETFENDQDYYNEEYRKAKCGEGMLYNHSLVFIRNVLEKADREVLSSFMKVRNLHPYSDAVAVFIESNELEETEALSDVTKCLENNIHLLVDYVAIDFPELLSVTVGSANKYINGEISEIEFAVEVMEQESIKLGVPTEREVEEMCSDNGDF